MSNEAASWNWLRDKRQCVYMLRDPRDGMEFYIGIGLKSRPKCHFKEADGLARNPKVAKIRKLRREGICDEDMVLYLTYNVSRKCAQQLEANLIEFLGRQRKIKINRLKALMADPVWMAYRLERQRAVRYGA